VEDQTGVDDDGDLPPVAGGDDLPQDVAALLVAVLLADPRGVVEQPDVRLCVGDDRLGAGLDEPLSVLLRVELAEETLVPVGDVHVDHCSPVGVLIPLHGESPGPGRIVTRAVRWAYCLGAPSRAIASDRDSATADLANLGGDGRPELNGDGIMELTILC